VCMRMGSSGCMSLGRGSMRLACGGRGRGRLTRTSSAASISTSTSERTSSLASRRPASRTSSTAESTIRSSGWGKGGGGRRGQGLVSAGWHAMGARRSTHARAGWRRRAAEGGPLGVARARRRSARLARVCGARMGRPGAHHADEGGEAGGVGRQLQHQGAALEGVNDRQDGVAGRRAHAARAAVGLESAGRGSAGARGVGGLSRAWTWRGAGRPESLMQSRRGAWRRRGRRMRGAHGAGAFGRGPSARGACMGCMGRTTRTCSSSKRFRSSRVGFSWCRTWGDGAGRGGARAASVSACAAGRGPDRARAGGARQKQGSAPAHWGRRPARAGGGPGQGAPCGVGAAGGGARGGRAHRSVRGDHRLGVEQAVLAHERHHGLGDLILLLGAGRGRNWGAGRETRGCEGGGAGRGGPRGAGACAARRGAA
jgi:hypothetical protein